MVKICLFKYVNIFGIFFFYVRTFFKHCHCIQNENVQNYCLLLTHIRQGTRQLWGIATHTLWKGNFFVILRQKGEESTLIFCVTHNNKVSTTDFIVLIVQMFTNK